MQDISQLLLPESDWAAPDICLYEGSDLITLNLKGAIQYHGLSSIGGLVLGFRLLQRALEICTEKTLVQRDDISIYTAFPGPGAKDAFEYICRAGRDQRYCCDVNLHHPVAQPGLHGQFYFQIRIQGQVVNLAPIDGQPPASFFAAARNSHTDQTAAQHWKDEKISLANTLLTLPPDQCIREL